MLRIDRALALLAAFGAVSAAAAPAAAQYKFKTFPGPKGGSQIYQDVNQAKDIVSEVTTSADVSSCTLIQGSAVTPINDTNGTYTQCYGLDSRDEVVGFYIPTSNPNTAVGFTYKAGTYADFIAQGSNAANGGTQLNAISANGKIIAGTYSDSNDYSIAFTLVGKKQTDVAIAGANYLVATGVNNAGDLTVQSFDVNGNIIANYVIVGSTVTAIAYPNVPKTTVHAINDGGIVVGNLTSSSGVEQGFTYDVANASYSAPIADAKDADTILIGINDKGVIVGGAVTGKGDLVGLLALPAQ